MIIIKNKSHFDLINPLNKVFVADLKERFTNYFNKRLISIYLAGSVGRGEDIPLHSDIDFIIILSEKLTIQDEKFINFYLKHLTVRTKVDLLFKTENDLKISFSKLILILKTDSVLIYGLDIRKNLKDFKIDSNLSNLVKNNNLLDIFNNEYDLLMNEKRVIKSKRYRTLIKLVVRYLLSEMIITNKFYSNNINDIINKFQIVRPEEKYFALSIKKYYNNPPKKINNQIINIEKIIKYLTKYEKSI